MEETPWKPFGVVLVFIAVVVGMVWFAMWQDDKRVNAQYLKNHQVYHQKMEELRKEVDRSGIFNEFLLFQPTHSPGFESRVHGSFSGGGSFLAWGLSGQLDGQGKTNTTITFVWVKNGKVYKNTLPESEIVFEKANHAPTVQFAYRLPAIPAIDPRSSDYISTDELEKIIEKYDSAFNLTPGQLIASSYLGYATIKMKPELLEKQLGIPMQSK